ncbi:MAG TPA: hypothetical protein VF647_16800 [Longimicrobium sp.]|jgi:hypothetical protein
MWSKVFRAARLGVAALLVSSLGGCLWWTLTETTDNRTIRFDGIVTRADGTPVSGATVEIVDGFGYFAQTPPPENAAPCSGEVTGRSYYSYTDPQGRYRVEELHERGEDGPCVKVQVTPLGISGLAPAAVKGESSTYTQPGSNRSLLHRRVDVVLHPAPAR